MSKDSTVSELLTGLSLSSVETIRKALGDLAVGGALYSAVRQYQKSLPPKTSHQLGSEDGSHWTVKALSGYHIISDGSQRFTVVQDGCDNPVAHVWRSDIPEKYRYLRR